MKSDVNISSLNDLRQLVHATLCRHENLVEEQFTLTESQLVRGGEPCGIQFTLRGPRQVRLGAVWASDRNDVYFYDARGERFSKTRLEGRIERDAA